MSGQQPKPTETTPAKDTPETQPLSASLREQLRPAVLDAMNMPTAAGDMAVITAQMPKREFSQEELGKEAAINLALESRRLMQIHTLNALNVVDPKTHEIIDQVKFDNNMRGIAKDETVAQGVEERLLRAATKVPAGFEKDMADIAKIETIQYATDSLSANTIAQYQAHGKTYEEAAMKRAEALVDPTTHDIKDRVAFEKEMHTIATIEAVIHPVATPTVPAKTGAPVKGQAH